MISVPDTDWLPEETDKTSSLDNPSLSGAQGYTNSLCVTEASIMSHCAVRVTFLSCVVDTEQKRVSRITDYDHLINMKPAASCTFKHF